jgi:hypothetical protein
VAKRRQQARANPSSPNAVAADGRRGLAPDARGIRSVAAAHALETAEALEAARAVLARDTYAAKKHLAAEEERFKGLVRERLKVLLYRCPHTTICESLGLLCMCSHATSICVLIASVSGYWLLQEEHAAVAVAAHKIGELKAKNSELASENAALAADALQSMHQRQATLKRESGI